MLKERGTEYITADVDGCDLIFEDNPNIRIFLGQESQGIGITLNSAKNTYYYSNSIDLEHRVQSLDRNYRIGQGDPVFVADSVVENSMEYFTLRLLDKKIDVKDLLQNKVQCFFCEKCEECTELAVRPYSKACVLYGIRVEAEKKTTLKLQPL